MMEKFYVYALLDTRKPGTYIYGSYGFDYEPFYIGKGSSNRLNKHFSPSEQHVDTNKFKQRIISKILKETGNKPKAIRIRKGLTEQKAFKLEISLIKLIGRRNLGIGPLSNLTNGGDGIPGSIYNPIRCLKISNTLKGRKHSASRVDNLRKSKCKRIYRLTSPSGEIIETNNLREFCRIHSLNNSSMYQVLRGKFTHHHNWKVTISSSLP